ncbi:hypothetical protein PPACK8108_LOCUS9706 [Phakopsora pachyrhizi]|uniref:Uncharacterized protein n=1 Tax=Phakopsora pachyrhizi TaxID=170000 RepID=A0AAV0B098_PHAPC|nr:hypothetical protein PPACK8108_LOCUS9706 [Phakopsora pachyrhizi]
MRQLKSLERVSVKSSVKTIRNSKNNLKVISNESYHGLLMTLMTAMDQKIYSNVQDTSKASKVTFETFKLLGDQNNKMDEEEESEVLMARLKEGLKEAMRS